LTIPCLHLLEQPLMAQTRRKGLLTGSRNIKTEFYGKVQFVPRSEPRSHAPILSLRAQLRFPQSAGKGRRAAPHTRRPLQVQRCASAPNAARLEVAERGAGRRRRSSRVHAPCRAGGPLQTGAAACRLFPLPGGPQKRIRGVKGAADRCWVWT